MPTVLRKRHSLKTISIVPLINRMRSDRQSPSVSELARIQTSKKMEDMEMFELDRAILDLTGESKSDILELADREQNMSNARLVLHEAILYANEVGHPQGQDPLETPTGSSNRVSEILICEC